MLCNTGRIGSTYVRVLVGNAEPVGAYVNDNVMVTNTAVVLEGVGACSAEARELLDVSVWVELPTALRYDRALSRDGSYYAEHWDRWAAQEDAYLAEDHVWEQVDILHPGPVC